MKSIKQLGKDMAWSFAFGFFILVALGSPKPADAAEAYVGASAAFVLESGLSFEKGIKTPNNTELSLMIDLGLDWYRFGIFASFGYTASTKELKDRFYAGGRSVSASLFFDGSGEVNLGFRWLVFPNRSWQQLYFGAGATFSPQIVDLILSNRLVERSYTMRVGGFVQGSYTVSIRRTFTLGFFARARYLQSSWQFKNSMRFPTKANLFALLIGSQATWLFGGVP